MVLGSGCFWSSRKHKETTVDELESRDVNADLERLEDMTLEQVLKEASGKKTKHRKH